MALLKAYVRNGRLVLDVPTDLPEGLEVDLVPAGAPSRHDEHDELDEHDRRRLHQALAQSEDDVAQGRVFAAEDVLSELREH